MKVFRKSLLTGLLAFGLTWAGPVGSASAHGGDEPPLPLSCANGETYYVVVVPGHGRFTPAHDVQTTAVFIPVSFGDFTGTISTAKGRVVKTFTEPGDTKGSGKQQDTTECTFSFTEAFTVTQEEAAQVPESDPWYLPAGKYVFEGRGSVVAQIRGEG